MRTEIINEQGLEIIFDKTLPQAGYLNNLLSSSYEIDVVNKDSILDFTTVFESNTIAPYVSPCVDGVPIYAEGGTRFAIKLPYVKVEDAITACDVFNTTLFIDGKLRRWSTSAADDTARYNLGKLKIIAAHRRAVSNLLEQQTVSLLDLGGIDTSSAYSNGEYIQFPRESALTTYGTSGATGTKAWDTSTGKPLDTIQEVADLMRNTSGALLTDIVMNQAEWLAFRSNPQITAIATSPANTPWAAQMPSPLPFIYNGVSVFKLDNSTTGSINIHVYEDVYQKYDTSGGTPKYVNTKFMPAKRALFIGRKNGEVQIGKAWGKIQSKQALKTGQTNSRVFVYEWEEKDSEQIITQTAPLMFGDANTFFGVQVLT